LEVREAGMRDDDWWWAVATLVNALLCAVYFFT
jgi:hypothetical protein